MTQLGRAPYETRRRVIDVSGDGDNNSGRDVAAARDEAIAKGVMINGLVILTETPTRWNSAHNCLPLRGRSRESSLGSELAPWERVQSE